MTSPATPRIAYAMMAVPSRAQHVPTIAARLGQPLRVSVDNDRRGPWWGWRSAWDTSAAHDPDATHRAILQDDVDLCGDFHAALTACVAARPGEPVSAFLPRKSVETAHARGLRWVSTRRFLWAQCLVLPVDLGAEALAWIASRESSAPEWGHHDDVRLAAAFNAFGRRVFVPVPNLLDHIGDAIGGSTLGHNGPAARRRARVWIGQDGQGAHLPWHDLRHVAE